MSGRPHSPQEPDPELYHDPRRAATMSHSTLVRVGVAGGA